jgi:hypothetical protein
MRAYVVWLPVRRAGDVASAARREGGRIHDSRALHFFDPTARLAQEYSATLHLPFRIPAWDVYMVFGPRARWDDQPPAPAYWMHQLGSAPRELRLDGKQLARAVRELLDSTGKAASLIGPGILAGAGLENLCEPGIRALPRGAWAYPKAQVF